MLQSVHWANEEAHTSDGQVEPVTVVLLNYEACAGKAMRTGGYIVDVSLTDYSLADLTIGVNAPAQPTCECE